MCAVISASRREYPRNEGAFFISTLSLERRSIRMDVRYWLDWERVDLLFFHWQVEKRHAFFDNLLRELFRYTYILEVQKSHF